MLFSVQQSSWLLYLYLIKLFLIIHFVRIGARFMDDCQECIRSCRQHGLLATQMICPTCNRYCTERALDLVVDGVTWHCSLKVCKNRIGIRHGSFFEKSHLQLWQILGLTYLKCRSAGKSRRLSMADARMNCKSGVSIP